MKVCHVTSAHKRYDGRIFRKQCVTLAKEGYEVILLCIDEQENEIKDGVKIISINKKFKNRYHRIISAKKILKKHCVKIDADIYQFHDPELESLAYYMKKLGKKVIFDSHEDYVASIEDKKWIPSLLKKPIKKIYEKLEKNKLSKLDGVFVSSPHIYSRLKNVNTNTVILENFPTLDEINNQISKRDNNVICFGGGISRQWMHHNIIKAIEKIKDVKYILAGPVFDGYLDELKSLKGFSKVTYKGQITKSELNDLYSKCEIGMALNDYVANVGYHEGSLGNTKIFEYMASQLPIIATDFNVWKKIIVDENCGICVNPNNIDEIENAIRKLVNNPKLATEMGKNGYNLVISKYNWENIKDKLLNTYEDVINKENNI